MTEENATVQKWEYVTVPLIPHTTKQILDNWGQQGYELVQVISGPGTQAQENFSQEGFQTMQQGSGGPANLVAYMKRPI